MSDAVQHAKIHAQNCCHSTGVVPLQETWYVCLIGVEYNHAIVYHLPCSIVQEAGSLHVLHVASELFLRVAVPDELITSVMNRAADLVCRTHR